MALLNPFMKFIFFLPEVFFSRAMRVPNTNLCIIHTNHESKERKKFQAKLLYVEIEKISCEYKTLHKTAPLKLI